jgi:hypothetical protein
MSTLETLADVTRIRGELHDAMTSLQYILPKEDFADVELHYVAIQEKLNAMELILLGMMKNRAERQRREQ